MTTIEDIQRSRATRSWTVGEKVFPTYRAAKDFVQNSGKDSVRERLVVTIIKHERCNAADLAIAIMAELSVKFRREPKPPGANCRLYAKR